MMYWGSGSWNWGVWAAMTLTMILFWGFIVWAVVMLIRRPTEDSTGSADRILSERLARGEIDETEYQRLRQTLRRRG